MALNPRFSSSKLHGVSLYVVLVLLVFPFLGMVTWYFIYKFDCTIFVDGLGHVFDGGPFDVNVVELREVEYTVD